MHGPITFHYLVRGILIADGKVLVAHELGAANTFLPGGHIEHGESAEAALVREIDEELGLRPTVRQFLGAVEHIWPEGALDNQEINLLFKMEIEGLTSHEPPPSCEPHLEFLWVDIAQLADVDLRPPALVRLLASGIEGIQALWGSSLEKADGLP